MFIKKLNEKNIILSEERKAEVIEEPESPVKRHRGNHPQTQILDQSSIQGDYSQLTGAFEDPSPVPPPLQIQIQIKQQSALDYLDDEVESIMSSAKKPSQK